MFRKSAAYYDLIYSELKDYPGEAMKLNYLLGHLDPKPRTLLDVGCGTGEHAKQLARNFGYQVDGIDIEPSFIEIASKKLPEGEFHVADMRDFSLPRRYDVVLCLFSSIGYAETLAGLRAAFASMAHHLKPGGWLICEPWATPENWRSGQVDALEAVDPETGAVVTRTRVGATEGDVSILTIEYDVLEAGQRHLLEEVHRLGLFTREQITEALQAAKFSPQWAEHSLHDGPMVVAEYRP